MLVSRSLALSGSRNKDLSLSGLKWVFRVSLVVPNKIRSNISLLASMDRLMYVHEYTLYQVNYDCLNDRVLALMLKLENGKFEA